MDYPRFVNSAPHTIVNYITELAQTGQIDVDDAGMPIVTRYDKKRGLHTVYLQRDGKPAYVIFNTLSKKPPVKSWTGDKPVRKADDNPLVRTRPMRRDV